MTRSTWNGPRYLAALHTPAGRVLLPVTRRAGRWPDGLVHKGWRYHYTVGPDMAVLVRLSRGQVIAEYPIRTRAQGPHRRPAGPRTAGRQGRAIPARVKG